MIDVKFSRYDTADYLTSEDDIAAYLDAAVEDGDPALIVAALGDVARAKHGLDRPRCWCQSRGTLQSILGNEKS